MNIKKRIKANDYTIDELVEWMDLSNPIILYEIFVSIVQHNIKHQQVIEKLHEISCKMGKEDVMLGYYKIGHVAMGVLGVLGIDETDIFSENLDDFDKELVRKFVKDSNW